VFQCFHNNKGAWSDIAYLIFQDEPTSGVDPRARQFLWSIVRGLISAGQSVLVTTHSMTECEALCSRVGIMVNGSFQCLGSPQQLKSNYGQGYRLKIRVGSQVEAVKEYIRQNMSTASLKVMSRLYLGQVL
jgi:ABC-type multidrug transport system ATPase subunit